MPEVSVIMSVYNGEPYLKDAIKSVLEQSFRDFEFLIVDDGSTDNSVKSIESFKDPRIKLIRQKNTGVAKAKNRALEIAGGKWTAIIDSDDIWYPSKLEKQLQFFEENPDFTYLGHFDMIQDIYEELEYQGFSESEIEQFSKNRYGTCLEIIEYNSHYDAFFGTR